MGQSDADKEAEKVSDLSTAQGLEGRQRFQEFVDAYTTDPRFKRARLRAKEFLSSPEVYDQGLQMDTSQMLGGMRQNAMANAGPLAGLVGQSAGSSISNFNNDFQRMAQMRRLDDLRKSIQGGMQFLQASYDPRRAQSQGLLSGAQGFASLAAQNAARTEPTPFEHLQASFGPAGGAAGTAIGAIF